jgi:uncharacterized membrane protein YhaH (DUF805 family)
MTAHSLLKLLLDPRGRCDREQLLLAAAFLLLLQFVAALALWLAGLEFTGRLAFTVNGLFCWMGFAAISKRLHDLGHSAWWVAGGLLMWLSGAALFSLLLALIAGSEALDPATGGLYWPLFAALMLPLLAAALWLHVARGQPEANRFGPPLPSARGSVFQLPAARRPSAKAA